jgi:hypothetical protein
MDFSPSPVLPIWNVPHPAPESGIPALWDGEIKKMNGAGGVL